jgi:hypothetical protein
MDIAHQAFVFTQVFVANAAAMASSTIASHGWLSIKVVPIHKPFAYQSGLADMTFTTGCMAGAAMIAKHLGNGFVIGRSRALIQHCPVTGQVVV